MYHLVNIATTGDDDAQATPASTSAPAPVTDNHVVDNNDRAQEFRPSAATTPAKPKPDSPHSPPHSPPHQPPSRWEAPPTGGPPPPVPPRADPPMPYVRVGVLHRNVGDETADNGGPRVLPLYGRRINPRSHRFNYRTRIGEGGDGSPAMELSVYDAKNDRDCTNDRNGCNEAWDGSLLTVSPYGAYTVDIARD